MVEDRSSSTASPPSSSGPSQDGYLRMPRVPEGRILAGVCSGIGRATGVDPVVIRVGFGVLLLTNGQGILLYIAAALLMPASTEETAPAERLFRRRFDRAAVLSILGALMGLGFALSMAGGPKVGDTLASITVLGLVLLVTHARGVDLIAAIRALPERLQGHPLNSYAGAAGATGGGQGGGGAGVRTGAGATAGAGGAAAGRVSLDKIEHGAETLPPGMIDLAAFSGGARSGTDTDSGGMGAAWPQDDLDDRTDRWSAGTAVVHKQRGTSPLTQITLLGAMAAGAAMIPFARGYPAPQSAMIIGSVALAVVGGGLLMSGWFRARGLATVGTVLTLSLLAGSAATEVPAGSRWGEVEWRPIDGTRTEQDYKLAAGSAVLDLTALPLRPGQRVMINAEVMLGGLKVKVPRNARIELDARIGLGDLSVDRNTVPGPRAKTEEVLLPADPAAKNPPVIALRIRGKVGDIQVDHV